MTITRTHRRTAHLLLALMLLLAALASNSANWAAPRVGAQEKGVPDETAGAINLLRNGSYELDANHDGKADDWDVYAFDGGTAARQAGGINGSFQLVARSAPATGSGFSFMQTVPVKAGVVYKATGWVNITAGTQLKQAARVQFVWKNANYEYITSPTVKEWQAPTSGYTWFAQQRKAPSGAAYLTLVFMSPAYIGTMKADGFGLRIVPPS